MTISELMDPRSLPATMSVEEAGSVLGLSRSAAYRAAARGELPTVRFGRRLFVPTPMLRAMLGIVDADAAPGSPR